MSELTRSQAALRGKNVVDMTDEQLHDWIAACDKMEATVKPAKARRSWRRGCEEARAEPDKRPSGEHQPR